MRKIDLHCCPGTAPWIASQGPYVEALATYWKKPWVAKEEAEVVADLQTHGLVTHVERGERDAAKSDFRIDEPVADSRT